MLKPSPPVRLIAAGLFLLTAVAVVLWATPSDQYLFLPDKAHPVAPLVDAPGAKDPNDGGGIYFVDVVVRRARLFDRLFPWVHDGATLVPASVVTPPGVNDKIRRQADLREMAQSQSVAAAVALRALGYTVVARPTGVLVNEVATDGPAVGKLRPADVIVAVDGVPVRTLRDLRRLMSNRHPGEVVRLTVRAGREARQVTVKTIADPADRRRALIGLFPGQASQVRLPLEVRIDAGGVGGPSAGLAFALDLMEELGRDVDHGYRVAATGAIDLDGSVRSIGGVKQKTLGARQADVDVFLVPAGENARDARRYADGLRVIPVKTFPQALQALATLPPKA